MLLLLFEIKSFLEKRANKTPTRGRFFGLAFFQQTRCHARVFGAAGETTVSYESVLRVFVRRYIRITSGIARAGGGGGALSLY